MNILPDLLACPISGLLATTSTQCPAWPSLIPPSINTSTSVHTNW